MQIESQRLAADHHQAQPCERAARSFFGEQDGSLRRRALEVSHAMPRDGPGNGVLLVGGHA